MTELQKRPVAFRVKAGDVWVLFAQEDNARAFAERMGVDYQGLYARLGTDGESAPDPMEYTSVPPRDVKSIKARVAALEQSACPDHPTGRMVDLHGCRICAACGRI